LYNRTISLSTSGKNDLIDITDHLEAAIRESGIRNGLVAAFVPHTTCALTTMELEPGTSKDLKEFLERWVPENARYHHNVLNHDTNGHAHLRASLLGPSLTLPVSGGKLVLGTWQTPVLIDCDDRPRTRKLIVTIVGEKN